MPRPVLASQSCVSTPGLVTPAAHLYSQDDSTNVKQTLECAPEGSRNYWTAPFRDGLPTPPSDMTGVAYNAIPSSYGGQFNRVSLQPNNAFPSNSRISRGPPLNAMVRHVKSQSNPGSTTKAQPPRPVDQKRPCSGSVAPYLQIPPSISSGKGSLAEFAAQVSTLGRKSVSLLTWYR